MLAAQYNEPITETEDYSKKIQLVAVEKPSSSSIPAEHALVKIHAASMNPIDWMVMAGFLKDAGWELPLPFTIGYDFSGVIEEINSSSNSSSFAVGDEVFAVNWGQGSHNTSPVIAGTFAQYILVSLDKLSKKHPDVSHATAAAVALVGTTAYEGLFEHCKVTKGNRVLILGGATSVGAIAVQLARNAGAWVATTASARTKDYVESLGGANLIVDYTQQKWEEIEQLKGIDVVFDCVGDTDSFARAKTILKSNGCFAAIASQDAGFDPKGHPPLEFAAFFCLSNNPKVQDKLMAMLASGELKLPVEQSFPFTQEGVVDLIKTQKSGKNKGKLVLTIVE